MIPWYRSMNRKHEFGSQLAVLGMDQEFIHFKTENKNIKFKIEQRKIDLMLQNLSYGQWLLK